MQRRLLMFIFLVVVVMSSGVWALHAHGASNTPPDSAGFSARISSAMTEPIGLVLLGVCLIALSLVVRRSLR